MPGSVTVSTITDTFPAIPYGSFAESRSWPVQENRYRNGELQSKALTTTSRKAYSFTALLLPAPLATLRDFYEAHGTHTPFQFTALDGSVRYCRFHSAWSQSANMTRTQVTLSLIEIS